MFFSINFSDSFRFTGWRKGAGKIFEFSKIFFLKMRFWNMPIALLESINLHQCSDIVNFAIAKDFF